MPSNLSDDAGAPPLVEGGEPAIVGTPPVVPGPLPKPGGPGGLAIASLVCGILSVVSLCLWCPGLPLGIAGLTCAYVSRERSGVRTAGMICSIVGTLIGLLCAALYVFSSMRNSL